MPEPTRCLAAEDAGSVKIDRHESPSIYSWSATSPTPREIRASFSPRPSSDAIDLMGRKPGGGLSFTEMIRGLGGSVECVQGTMYRGGLAQRWSYL